MKYYQHISIGMISALLFLAGATGRGSALEFSQLAGNWAVEISDSVVGRIEGEISFRPGGNPTYVDGATAEWFRDRFGEDRNTLQSGRFDGSNYYTKIYSPHLFPIGPRMRHMNVTFSPDGRSGSGTVHYGDDASGSVTMRKMVPELTASLCCGVEHASANSVENGVLIDPRPGRRKAIWIRLDGSGLPANMWVFQTYIDVRSSDAGLEYWKAGRNDSGIWYLAFWIRAALAPGERTITLNGVDVPVYIPIRQPDGTVAGAAPEVAEAAPEVAEATPEVARVQPEAAGDDDVRACSDADKALDAEFSAAAARTRSKIDAVGELSNRGRYGRTFDVEIAGGRDYARIAIVLRDIKMTLGQFAGAANACDAAEWDLLIGRLVNHQEQLDRHGENLDRLEYRMLSSQAPLWQSLASLSGDDDLARILEKAETSAQVLLPKAGVDPERADQVLDHVDEVLKKYPIPATAGAGMVAYADMREWIRQIDGLGSEQAGKVRMLLSSRDGNEVLRRYVDAVSDVAAELQPMILAARIHRPAGTRKLADAQ